MSNLSAIPYITSPSAGTTGLWNQRYSVISANFAALNSDLTLSSPSGNTFSILSGLEVVGGGHFQYLSVGSTPPSYVTTAAITVEVNSAYSDYLYFIDSSAQKSSYVIGSRAGNLADGLNIWDASAGTMIASFSKQSIRFFQNVVGPVFDVGGALASTLNAATFGTGANSKESRIQAAISAASIAGISRVYVPANMYPYSAASVSFDTRVQMVREGGDWSVWDVKAYGAAGNNTADDTAALQAAIHAVSTNNANQANGAIALGPVYIPPGNYKVTSTITVGQVTGLHISGAGNSVTEIVPISNMTSLFDLEGFAYSSLGNLNVQVQASRVTNLIYIHYDGAGRTSAGWKLYDMLLGRNAGAFGNYITGIAVGTNNALQNDTAFIQNVSILGSWVTSNTTTHQFGIDLGNGAAGNTLNISIYDCQFVDLRYGIRCLGAGAINGYGLFFRKTEMDINGDGTQAELSFRGIRSEAGTQFISCDVTSGSAGAVHLGDITWECENLTAATDVIQIRSSGVAVMDNIAFQTVGAFCPRIKLEAGGGALAGKSCLIINGLTTGAFTPAQTFASCFGPVVVSGYVQTSTGEGSSPTKMIPFLIYDNPGFFTPPSQAQFGPGLVTAPSITLSSEVSLGFYRSGVSTIGLSYGALALPAGSATTPSLGFSSETSLGWYRSTTSTMQLSYGTLWIPDKLQVDGAQILGGSLSLLSGQPIVWADNGALRSSDVNHQISFRRTENILQLTEYGDIYLSPNQSGANNGVVMTAGVLSLLAGAALKPTLCFSSESSLGFYRSGVSTIAPSFGTLNLATNAVRLSMRTLAASAVTASAANTNVAVNEVVVTVQTSGASFAINSGGTTWIFSSVASAKNT